MANGLFGGGDGTHTNPLIIEDVADLTAATGPSNSYRLKNDIDVAGVQLSPGRFGSFNYSGTFDGAGFSIKNWSYTGPATNFAFIGVFGSGTVKNLHLKNVNLINTSANGTTASLVSLANSHTGVISGCSSSGLIQGNSVAGGLLGYSTQSVMVSNCFSTCEVRGSNSVGGLIGSTVDAPVSNCYAVGNVYGNESVGGFIGSAGASSILTNCYSSGAVHGVSYTGGFVGGNSAPRRDKNCYSLAPYVQRISGTDSNFGSYSANGALPLPENKCYSLVTTEFRSV